VAALFSGTLASWADFRVKPELPLASRTEAAQARQSRGFALSQIENDLVDYSVELVGRFCFGQVRPLSQFGCKLSFVHLAHTLAHEPNTLSQVVCIGETNYVHVIYEMGSENEILLRL
jgi:hypothetical protein